MSGVGAPPRSKQPSVPQKSALTGFIEQCDFFSRQAKNKLSAERGEERGKKRQLTRNSENKTRVTTRTEA